MATDSESQATRRGRKPWIWGALKSLEVHKSIFVRNRTQTSVSSVCTYYGKKYNKRFITRVDEKDGTPGIRIWRIE